MFEKFFDFQLLLDGVFRWTLSSEENKYYGIQKLPKYQFEISFVEGTLSKLEK